MSEVYYTSQVEKLEADREAKKQSIALRESVQRLLKNPDFKTLIMDGFCLHECARYIEMAGSPDLTPEARANSLNIAQAGGHLRRYLAKIQLMTATAERDVLAIDAELEQARAEEGAV